MAVNQPALSGAGWGRGRSRGRGPGRGHPRPGAAAGSAAPGEAKGVKHRESINQAHRRPPEAQSAARGACFVSRPPVRGLGSRVGLLWGPGGRGAFPRQAEVARRPRGVETVAFAPSFDHFIASSNSRRPTLQSFPAALTPQNSIIPRKGARLVISNQISWAGHTISPGLSM